jgi:hypothetical protein
MRGKDQSSGGSYEDVINSSKFKEDLFDLNKTLHDFLVARGEKPILNGNLFYASLRPNFLELQLDPDTEAKRRRLAAIARRGSTLLEIGVNGGHSLLLAKHANPDLRCIGIDICARLDPAWARVDLYVPVAMQWLTERFPGSFRFFRGNSLLECPRLAVEEPELQVDILHVDGDKDTYFRDIVNLLPLLRPHSIIVVDDTNLPRVQLCVRRLLRSEFFEMHSDFPEERDQKYQHVILRPVLELRPKKSPIPKFLRRLDPLRRVRHHLPFGWL